MSTPSATGIERSLAKLPMLSHLEEKERKRLARLLTAKSYEPGEVIFEEGSIALGLFFIISGKTELYKKAEGREIGVGTVEAGQVLGALALLDEQPRSASARAAEATECLLLTRDGFETLVKRDPRIAWSLVPGLAARLRDLRELQARAVLEHQMKQEAGATQAKEKAADAAAQPKGEEGHAKGEEEADTATEKEDDEVSDLESAMFKMMRMQYGMFAGAAKGMTEMARMMETFVDSFAEESELKTNDSWRDFLEKLPEATVNATRSAMDEGEKVPQEMVDTFRRYRDEKS